MASDPTAQGDNPGSPKPLLAPIALVLGIVTVLFGVAAIFTGPGPTPKAQSIKCVSNLKQIRLAARMWADEHSERFPADFVEFQTELTTPKILWCPKDKSRKQVTDWKLLTPANVSYVIVSPGTTNQDSSTVFARCPVHGHEVMTDGSVIRGAALKKTP
jgi:hypothetical protein